MLLEGGRGGEIAGCGNRRLHGVVQALIASPLVLGEIDDTGTHRNLAGKPLSQKKIQHPEGLADGWFGYLHLVTLRSTRHWED